MSSRDTCKIGLRELSLKMPSGKSNKKRLDDDLHLVVLQHGFQGSSYDMRMLKNTLLAEFPSDTLVRM